MIWQILDKYCFEFEKIQKEKGVLNPIEQRRKIADACREYRGNVILVREMTEEEKMLDSYWKNKIDDWLREEEIYYTKRILEDFGYAEAEKYALGQYRKSGVKEFFENIRPCDYGENCIMYCKDYINNEGEMCKCIL